MIHRIAVPFIEATHHKYRMSGAMGHNTYAETKAQISTFVFATWIVQLLNFLNPKYQASSHLLCLYSSVCVRPGQKPQRPPSRPSSYILLNFQIPSLNDIPLHSLKPNSLVRLRCMIQDMYDPEFYLGLYEVEDNKTGAKTMRSGKYKDVAQCGVRK